MLLKTFWQKSKPIIIELAIYLVIFLIAIFAYITIVPIKTIFFDGAIPQGIVGIFLLIMLMIAIVLKIRNQLTIKRIILLIIASGIIIRLGYILYTNYDCRQYDTWTTNYDGHFAYADILFNTGKLPTTNVYQFYHPPFNAFIQSLFMHFWQGVSNFVNNNLSFLVSTPMDPNNHEALYGAAQTLGIVYTTVIVITAAKSFKLIGLKDWSLVLAIAFVALYPRFVQLSGQLNNDLLCIMFCFLSVYFTIKWWKTRKWIDIIAIAIAIGLAMMTKLSSATICFTTAIIFLIVLIKVLKEKNKQQIWKIIAQYVVFLIICAPLALWFQVYAAKEFAQPIAYVFGNLNSELSTADYSFFARFVFPTTLKEWFGYLYCSAFENYNVWLYMLRSSIFGEFSYWNGSLFAGMALISNLVVTIVFLICLIKYLKKTKFHDKSAALLIFGSLFVVQIVMQIYFNIKMPYGCTMDFRYVVPLVYAVGGLIGLSYDSLNSDGPSNHQKWANLMKYVVIIFLVTANLFYCVCI